MDEEQLLNLFDSNWYYNDIITTQSLISPFATNPDLEFPFKTEITRMQSSLVRSVSEDLQSQISFTCASPDSVLRPQQLQTISSGKEVSDEQKLDSSSLGETRAASKKLMIKGKRMNKMKKSSKSLSDLEFEELKGFMDLGFVFSEEDKNSSLVSIIPGLQRLRNKGNLIITEQQQEEEEEDKSRTFDRGENNNKSVIIQRPYLSEAWAVLDNKTKEEELALITRQVPKSDSETAMKFHLRNWAHTIASAVR